MNNVDYAKVIELYNEYYPKILALENEFTAKVMEAYGEEAKWFFSVPGDFGTSYKHIQCYPDKPTEGARLRHSDDDTDYYELFVGDMPIIEAVRK